MEKIIKDLNDYLADLNVFYRKLQNYHWNITGTDFFVVHAKLEEYYNEINEQIDEVAEHILTLNNEPLGTMKDYLSVTKIAEAKNEKVKSDVVIENIVKDFEILLNDVKSIKKEADNIQCYATSSLVDEFILDYSKKLWMLKEMMCK